MSRLAILVLGAGGMGQRHAKAYEQTGRCDIYCFDESDAAIEKIQKLNNLTGTFSDIDAIPAKLFSGVIIATPTDTHLHYAKWCLNNKIPFLVEKPLATHEGGLRELIAEVKAQNLVSGVAFPRRSSIAVREIKCRVERGDIGDVKLIRCNFSQDFRKYRPDYNTTYYAALASGGGVIMDALSHHINLACYFGGNVRQVSAFYDRLAFEDVEVEDCAFINLRFLNGILGAIHGNQFQKPNEDSIELIGTAGSLKYERLSGKLLWNMSDSINWHDELIDGDWNEIIRNQANEFLDAIVGKGNVKTTLQEGLHHLRIVLAARLSQEKHSVIEV